jgi:predicted MFS family arabinose efflux permease
MGTLGAIGSAGVLTSLGAVYLLRTVAGFGMRELFMIAGVVTALGAVPLLFMKTIRAEKPEVYPALKLLAPRYRLYLSLELLDGMRKQVFILFAILALVREHGIQMQTIAGLMLVNQVVNLFVSPAAGKLVDRIGERRVLSIYFGGLVGVFLLYTVFRNIHALFAVYLVDSMMWSLAVAKSTYANRIVEKGERTRLLAMGITMNHVGAVTLPIIGGMLYAGMGYRFPFYCGAAIALISLFIAQRVPERR